MSVLKKGKWILTFGLGLGFWGVFQGSGTAFASSGCVYTGNDQTRCCTTDLTPTWWCPADRLSADRGACHLKVAVGDPLAAGDLYRCAPVTLPAGTGAYRKAIVAIASGSSCSKYSWKNRGQAPAGYMKGLVLSYARSLCRSHEPALASPEQVMAQASVGRTSVDALAYYSSILSSMNLQADRAGPDTLTTVYTLAAGLGMRESSGNYCEGWDTSAGSNRSSSEAEAGLFQTSYNSIGASPELSKLYDAYRAHPEWCLLDVFKEGASCSPQSILGSGAGADYQRFNKTCPAFAAEYVAVMLRVNRSHYGPINTRKAEVTSACHDVFSRVEAMVEQDPANVCSDLF